MPRICSAIIAACGGFFGENNLIKSLIIDLGLNFYTNEHKKKNLLKDNIYFRKIPGRSQTFVIVIILTSVKINRS